MKPKSGRRVKETGQRVWEGELIALVGSLTGMSRADARVAWRASMRAIVEELLDGREVHLRGIGKFLFAYNRPRQLKKRWSHMAKRMLPAMTTKGGHTLRFRISAAIKTKLLAVKPETSHMPLDASGTVKGKAAAKLAAEQAAEGQAPA